MSQSETATPAKAARRTRTQTAGPQAQEHLLRAAGELFYEEGVRAVGSMRSSSGRASTR